MSNIYFISDLHLQHKNIIDYCNRPFNTVDEMNSALIERWNSIITDDDIVFFVGDFCLGSKDDFIHFTSLLKGQKHFFFGNHDRISKSNVLNAGWETAQHTLNLTYKGQKIRIQHYPTADVPDDTILIYGHVHDKPASELPHKSFCVSAERLDYRPVTIDYILEHLDYQNFEER